MLAGTVLTTDDVERAVAAGAEACVGPTFVPEVVERCLELDVPAIPGALTPTEIAAAWKAGAALVKLFPAATLGPRYVRDLLGPLADAPLLATGGIDAGNARGVPRGRCGRGRGRVGGHGEPTTRSRRRGVSSPRCATRRGTSGSA